MPTEESTNPAWGFLVGLFLVTTVAVGAIATTASAQSPDCELADDPSSSYACIAEDVTSSELGDRWRDANRDVAIGAGDVSQPLDLGFTFPWFGETRTQVNVSSYGTLCFTRGGDDCLDHVSQETPDPETPNDLVTCGWNFLDPSRGDVRFQDEVTVDGVQAFVVTFDDVPHYLRTGATVTYQVQILETGVVHCLIDHIDEDTDDDSKTAIGIENATGEAGVRFEHASFSTSNTIVSFGQTPGAPQAVSADPGLREINVTWDAPEDAVDKYTVHRRPTAQGDATTFEVPGDQTWFLDDELPDDEDFYYEVSTTNDFGESTLSEQANATTFGEPSEPRNLSAQPGAERPQVDLDWDPPVHENATEWYHVLRNASDGSGFEQVDNVTTTDWTDPNATVGFEYTYKVRALNPVGPSPASETNSSFPAGPTAPPTPPENLTAEPGNATGLLNVTWDTPAQENGTRYYHVYRNASDGSGFEQLDNVTATSWTDENTTLGTLYTYRVEALAFRSIGSSDASGESSSAPAGPPSAPTEEQADANATADAIDLSWSKPASTGGSPVTEYRINRSLDNGTFGFRASVDGSTTSFSDSAVDCGSFYQYRIYAINEHGAGQPALADEFSRLGCPSAPQNASASQNLTAGAVNVSWDAPADTGNGAISSYLVDRSPENGSFDRIAEVSDGTFLHDSKVDCRTSYTYRIAANNTENETGPFATTNLTVDQACPSVPGEFGADANDTKGTIDLNWTRPTRDGFSPLGAYNVSRSADGGPFQNLSEIQVGDTSYADGSVECDRDYTYRVVARNGHGSSLPNETNISTAGFCPSEVWNASADTNATEQAVVLAWNEVNSTGTTKDLTHYHVERAAEGQAFEPIADVDPAGSTFADTEVDCRTDYRYRISANNTYGNGSAALVSATVQDACPSAPTNATAIPGTNAEDTPPADAIQISWNASVDEGWSGVSSYEIERCDEDGLDCGPSSGNWVHLATVSSADPLTYTDEDLGPDETWAYRITATNDQGPSVTSTIATATTPSAPSKPQNVDASSVTGGQLPIDAVQVTWDPPADTGDISLLQYHVYRRSLEAGTVEQIDTVPADTTSYQDTPNSPGAYCYAVSANNTFEGELGGDEDPTTEPTAADPTDPTQDCSAFVTAESPPTASCDGAFGDVPAVCPRAPENATASGANLTVHLDWERPSSRIPSSDGPLSDAGVGTNETILAYRVYRNTTPDCAEFEHHVTVESTSHSDTDLAPGTKYCYHVTALRGDGTTSDVLLIEGDASETVSAWTDGPPTPPQGLTAAADTPGVGNVTLTWSAPQDNNGSDVTGYKVYRDVSCTGNRVHVDTVSKTTYEDHNNTAGDDAGMPAGDYCYEVIAVNGVGESSAAASDPATVTNLAPSEPHNAAATSPASSEIKVSWDDSNKTGGSPLFEFRIERQAEGTDTWEKAGTVSADSPNEFTDDGLAQGVEFCYRISAVNTAHDAQGNDVAGLESSDSKVVCATA